MKSYKDNSINKDAFLEQYERWLHVRISESEVKPWSMTYIELLWTSKKQILVDIEKRTWPRPSPFCTCAMESMKLILPTNMTIFKRIMITFVAC